MALIKREQIVNDHDIMSHVILNSMCTGDKKRDAEIIESWKDEKGHMPEVFEVVLTVNGQELNPESFFSAVWEQYEYQVRKDATTIVKEQTSEKLEEMVGKIYEVKKALEEAVENINWDLNLNK